jgi:hypothetical protein
MLANLQFAYWHATNQSHSPTYSIFRRCGISPTWHFDVLQFANVAFRQHGLTHQHGIPPKRHFTSLQFANVTFCHHDISPSPTWHFSNMTLHHITIHQCGISPKWHFTIMTFGHLFNLPRWHFTNMTFRQSDISPAYNSSKWHFANIKFRLCQCRISPTWHCAILQFANVAFCQHDIPPRWHFMSLPAWHTHSTNMTDKSPTWHCTSKTNYFLLRNLHK